MYPFPKASISSKSGSSPYKYNWRDRVEKTLTLCKNCSAIAEPSQPRSSCREENELYPSEKQPSMGISESERSKADYKRLLKNSSVIDGEAMKLALHSNHTLQHAQTFLFAVSSQFMAERTKADWIYKELSNIKCALEIFKKRDLF